MTDPRLEHWLKPITAPAAEARFHPSFETVRSETAKLDSPSAGPPDWAQIVSAGDVFLREVGKDLVVATSLALALGHREGWTGLAAGLALVEALLRDASCAPPRPRARANALSFLITRSETALDLRPPREATPIDALAVALTSLGGVATETLGAESPSFRPLVDRVQRARASLPTPTPVPPAPAPPPEPEPKAVFVPPPPAAPPAPAPTEPRAESIPTQLRKSAAALLETASAMRAGAPLDADALRVTLAALHLPMSSLPPTTRGARTALPPPPKLVLDAIERLADGPVEAVVREVLGALERHRLALDLHLHLSRALARGGEAAAECRRAHRHELTGLHARLPALVTLEFSDGTPFASPATRELFDELTRPAATRATEASAPTALDTARELAREGRLSEALSHATRVRAEASSGRARFEATLALATLAEEARAIALAEELHAALLREADERHLEMWEPSLLATALSAHLRLARATTGREALAKSLFGRLAVVDPAAALSFAPPHATPAKSAR